MRVGTTTAFRTVTVVPGQPFSGRIIIDLMSTAVRRCAFGNISRSECARSADDEGASKWPHTPHNWYRRAHATGRGTHPRCGVCVKYWLASDAAATAAAMRSARYTTPNPIKEHARAARSPRLMHAREHYVRPHRPARRTPAAEMCVRADILRASPHHTRTRKHMEMAGLGAVSK